MLPSLCYATHRVWLCSLAFLLVCNITMLACYPFVPAKLDLLYEHDMHHIPEKREVRAFAPAGHGPLERFPVLWAS